MDQMRFLQNYFHQHDIGVISTVDPRGMPEAAVVQFGETENLEFIFGTPSTTRKYKNILHNSSVAFVIGWDEDFSTVQYEGTAVQLVEPDLSTYKKILFDKIPDAKKWEHVENMVYLKILPKWIRYADLQTQWEVNI